MGTAVASKCINRNEWHLITNYEVTGTRSVREHGSVDQAELNSPSAMISSSETS